MKLNEYTRIVAENQEWSGRPAFGVGYRHHRGFGGALFLRFGAAFCRRGGTAGRFYTERRAFIGSVNHGSRRPYHGLEERQRIPLSMVSRCRRYLAGEQGMVQERRVGQKSGVCGR